MTSKQAKKAYLQARRRPKLSREEQRRLDREELERQKKEFEREKAAAKAKLAREKKAAKAAAEKEERKRKGLPEPNRSVRASQPRISFFVQKLDNGNKRTWEDEENAQEESRESSAERTVQDVDSNIETEAPTLLEKEHCDVDTVDQEYENAPAGSKDKIPEALTLEGVEEFQDAPTASKDEVPALLPPEPEHVVEEPPILEIENRNAKSTQLELELEEAEIRPTMVIEEDHTQSQTIEQAASESGAKEDRRKDKTPDLVQDSKEEIRDFYILEELANVAADTRGPSTAPSKCGDSDDEFGPFPSMSQLDIPILRDNNSSVENQVCQPERIQGASNEDNWSENTQGYIELRDGPPSRRRRKAIRTLYDGHLDYGRGGVFPTRHRLVHAFFAFGGCLPECDCEFPPIRYHGNSQTTRHSRTPPSVASSNRPTRVCRETTGNARPTPSLQRQAVHGASIHKSKPAPPNRPSATQSFLEQHLDDFFPSPSQEVRELLTSIDDLPSNTQIEKELQEPPMSRPEKPPDIPPILTQDFMSSEEEFEITAPRHQLPPVPLFSTQDIMSSEEELEITAPRHQRPPVPLFSTQDIMSSQEEQEVAAVLPQPVAQQDPGVSDPLKPRSPFFEEKEEDLFHAALEESKMMADGSTKKHLPSASREPRPPVSSQKRQRTPSVVTDYGDDELRDCEDELFALLD